MPRYLEEAAHLLKFMVTAGLVIPPGASVRILLLYLSDLVALAHDCSHTHAEAADMILTDLDRAGLASWDAKSKPRLLAITGTSIGNLLTMAAAHGEQAH